MRRVLALLLCAFLVPLSAASLARAQDTEPSMSEDASPNMSQGQVSATARPRLTFSPAAGWPGTRVELTGQGFLPFERVRVLVGRTARNLNRHKTNAEFSDNDSDKSGALSIEEMIEEKLADFEQIDMNDDGSLTLDELEKTYTLK
jgi:hypothetical protein